MADLTLNRYIASGNTAARLAFTPSPATPGSGPAFGEIWWDTDLQALFAWNQGTTAWVAVAGSGTVAAAAIAQILRRPDDRTKLIMIPSAAAAGGSGTVTSVAIAVPTILTVSGSPITTAGTITLALATGVGAIGNVLVEAHTASSSATLDFTTSISASYDEYEIHFISIVPSTNGAGILMRMSTDGGATYDASAGHYSWQMWFMWNAGGSANGSTSDSSITIDNNISSGSGVSYGGCARLYNPAAATSLFTLIEGTGNVIDSSRTATDSAGTMFSGKYRVTGTAVNAFRFLMSSGNIASGTIRVYGCSK